MMRMMTKMMTKILCGNGRLQVGAFLPCRHDEYRHRHPSYYLQSLSAVMNSSCRLERPT
jgi:hypothetical protein